MASLPDHLKPVPVGRERLPKEVLEGHQRDRVLNASVEVFAERGYNSTTVDHLVAAAQIGVGSFYALFVGKEDCFLQLYDRIVADVRAQVEARLSDSGSWPDRVCVGLQTILAAVAADPLRARIVLVEAETAGPEARARHERTREEVIALLRGGRSLDRGDSSLPDNLEIAVGGGLFWLVHQLLVTGAAGDALSVFPEMARIVLEPYTDEADEIVAAFADRELDAHTRASVDGAADRAPATTAPS